MADKKFLDSEHIPEFIKQLVAKLDDRYGTGDYEEMDIMTMEAAIRAGIDEYLGTSVDFELNFTEVAIEQVTTKTLRIALKDAPLSDFKIKFASDSKHVSFEPEELVFTVDNYSTAQSVVIRCEAVEGAEDIIGYIAINGEDDAVIKKIKLTVQPFATQPDMRKLKLVGDDIRKLEEGQSVQLESLNLLKSTTENTLEVNGKAIVTMLRKKGNKCDYKLTMQNDKGVTTNYKLVENVDPHNEYVLMGEFEDPSHARNVFAGNLFKYWSKEAIMSNEDDIELVAPPNATSVKGVGYTDFEDYITSPGVGELKKNFSGIFNGFPVMVYINDKPMGVYIMANNQDYYKIYGCKEDNTDNALFKCVMNSKAATFTELVTATKETDNNGFVDMITPNNGDANRMSKLNRVVQWVMGCKNQQATFADQADEYFQVDYLIDYYVLMEVLGITNNMAKNMMLLTFNGNIWYVLPYECKFNMGIDADGNQVPADADIFELADGKASEFWKLVKLGFAERIQQRYNDLRNLYMLDEEIINILINNIFDRIPELAYKIDKAVESNMLGFELSTPAVMKQWLKDRLAHLDQKYNYAKNNNMIRMMIACDSQGYAPGGAMNEFGDYITNYEYYQTEYEIYREDFRDAIKFTRPQFIQFQGDQIETDDEFGTSARDKNWEWWHAATEAVIGKVPDSNKNALGHPLNYLECEVPMYTLKGNNDGNYNGRFVYENAMPELPNNYYYVKGNCLFVILNTEIGTYDNNYADFGNYKDGEIVIPSAADTNTMQQNWVRQIVAKVEAEHPEVKWKIACMHTAPFNYGVEKTSTTHHYENLFEEMGFDLISSGHRHTHCRSCRIGGTGKSVKFKKNNEGKYVVPDGCYDSLELQKPGAPYYLMTTAIGVKMRTNADLVEQAIKAVGSQYDQPWMVKHILPGNSGYTMIESHDDRLEVISYKIEKQTYNLEVPGGTDYTLRDAYPCSWTEMDRFVITKNNNIPPQSRKQI